MGRKRDAGVASLWTKDFILVNLINIFYGFGFAMMLPLVPLYIVFCGGGPPEVGVIAASFSAAAILIRFATPSILERISKTTLLRIAVLISIVITASCIFMESIPGIAIVRVMQGVGFGIVSTVLAVLATDLLPDSRRGEGIGYFGLGNVFMGAISPAVGLTLVDIFGFWAAFTAASAGQVISLFCIAAFKPDPALLSPTAKGRPRIRKDAPDYSRRDRLRFLIGKFYDRRLMLQSVLLFLFGIVRCAEMNYLPLLAKQEGIALLSLYYIVQTGTSFSVRIISGRTYDSRGRNWVLLPSITCLILSLIVYSLAHSLWPLLLGGILNGAGLGALQPTMQTWAMSTLPAEKRSVASAAFYNFYDLGITGGSIAMGYCAAFLGYAATYRATIIPAALFLLIYVISMLRSGFRFRDRNDRG